MPGRCDDFGGVEREDGLGVGWRVEDFTVAGDEADDEEGACQVAPEGCVRVLAGRSGALEMG